ncbi:hypothetical protein LZ198_41605 [Myxococcus sp. K15C18031901]|uniref:hypothetical protein n=1 Tax=Myxococcus dinghuensis TaxID=2906761 RepID=UPI0020A7D9DD|nr:hypothetical protein [Myxococcus dinghuensis]MCP3105379.1 hypothetical protein [Myxococcus dinghuensis]
MSYEPSQAEWRRFRRTLARLRPTAEAYQQYREDVHEYLLFHRWQRPKLRVNGKAGTATRLMMRRSELFEQDYLVVCMDSEWFQTAFPTFDALAVGEAETPFFSRPPLVIIPETKARTRGVKFHSILEHEIVHVNQMLLGAFPQSEAEHGADELLRLFFEHMRVEYEANLLQLTKWPRLYPVRLGASLDRWCAFRGYSQSLENTLVLAAEDEHFSGADVVGFLERILEELPVALRKAGMNSALASWFRGRHIGCCASIAVSVVEQFPHLKSRESLQAAGRWIRTQLG